MLNVTQIAIFNHSFRCIYDSTTQPNIKIYVSITFDIVDAFDWYYGMLTLNRDICYMCISLFYYMHQKKIVFVACVVTDARSMFVS